MKYTYEGSHGQTVIAPTNGGMGSHLQLEQSSVIKTAPGRHQQDFNPTKQEPMDMVPLSTLQDLSKMQPMDHYCWGSSVGTAAAFKGPIYYEDCGINGVYPAAAIASTSSLAGSLTTAAVSCGNPILDQLGNGGQDWRTMADPYSYQHQQHHNDNSGSSVMAMRLNHAANYVQQQQHQQHVLCFVLSVISKCQNLI
jgi:hypothetical protein